ncbi:MAG: histidine phosphatase family protein [Pseudarcicella sp.]|jgi:probable phosphoglycerate mutase|nr:histidine phosphatase family protein [Pseudarcicella sp.]MBP6411309.1 histidine phosphatase family protein [Pseudarcicella sp.]
MSSQKKVIYLIRHGETDFNKMGVVQGSGIDSELNETGLLQANAFFQKYKDIAFDKIYTSKLKRTHQSVKQFIDAGFVWEQHEGLNEISWGNKEGKIPNDIDNLYYKSLIESWASGDINKRSEEGESPMDVVKRQIPVFDLILSRKDENTILVAMHGRAIRILLTHLLENDLKNMDSYEHANLCLYKLLYNYDNNSYEVELSNDVSHLADIEL